MAEGDLQTGRELAGEIFVNGRGGETLLDQLEPYHLTDQGNARRLVAQHGENLRYCHPWREWLYFNGINWEVDQVGEVHRLAKNTVANAYLETVKCTDAEERRRLVKWPMQSESNHHIEAMIASARSEPGIWILPSQLDTHPWLLNCPNGTLDLQTGEMRDHRRADLIAQVTAAEYDPDAGYDRWDDFIERILPDLQQRLFVQRALGSSITGLPTEERLFFAFGQTATGKSTLLRAVRTALGDFAVVADFGTFLERRNQGPRNDVAALAGKRLVFANEVNRDEKLDESAINTMTGGDPVRARRLYQESFEFQPTFTLWLAANNRPRVRDDSDAIWRRIVQIPFNQQIPENERNPNLKSLLCDPVIAGPAVLAWLVQGCLDWQANGLCIPESVKSITAEYRAEMDPLADFLQEHCVLGPDVRAGNGELWDSYQDWIKANGVRHPVVRKSFTQRMAAIEGVSQRRGHGGSRYWAGIGLTADEALLGDR